MCVPHGRKDETRINFLWAGMLVSMSSSRTNRGDWNELAVDMACSMSSSWTNRGDWNAFVVGMAFVASEEQSPHSGRVFLVDEQG